MLLTNEKEIHHHRSTRKGAPTLGKACSGNPQQKESFKQKSMSIKRYDPNVCSSETFQGMQPDEYGEYVEYDEVLNIKKQLFDLALSNMQSANAALDYGDRDNALIYRGRADAFEEAALILSGKKERKRT